MKHFTIIVLVAALFAAGCANGATTQAPPSQPTAVAAGCQPSADITDTLTAQDVGVDLIMKAAWLEPDDFPVEAQFGGMWVNRHDLVEGGGFLEPQKVLDHMRSFGVKGAWEAQVSLRGDRGAWNISVKAVFTPNKVCGKEYGDYFGMSGQRLSADSGQLPSFVDWEFLSKSTGYNQALIVTDDGTVFVVLDQTFPEGRIDVRHLAEVLAQRYREQVQ